MKSILEEIFYSNIDPNISCFEENSNFGKAMKQISDNEENLIKLLEEPAKSMFFDFSNAQMEANSLTAIEKFSFGFKFGALLMIEVFINQNELFRED